MNWTDLSPEEHDKEKSWADLDPADHESLSIKAPGGDEESSGLKSLTTGLTNLGGISPWVSSAGKTAMDVLTGITPLSDSLEDYRDNRDKMRAEAEKAHQANPKLYTTGELLGGAALAPLTAGASTSELGADALAQAMKTGATYGGLQGFSNSKGDLTKGEIGQVAEDTAGGIGLGGLMGYGIGKVTQTPQFQNLMESLGSVPSDMQEGLDSFANQRALKATGIMKAQQKLLQQQGRTDEIGDSLLRNGVVTPLATPQDVLERSQNLVQKSGKTIGDLLQQFDNNFVQSNSGDVTEIQKNFFNPTDVANKIQEKLLDPISGYNTTQSEQNVLENAINDIKSFGDQPIPFQEAAKIKKLLSDATNFQGQSSTDEAMKRVVKIVGDEIENSGQKVAQASGDANILQKYLDAKTDYGAGKEASKAAMGKTAALNVNRDYGLTDYLAAGTTAAATHNVPLAVAAGITNHVGKKFGNSLLATGAKSASNMIGKISGSLASASEDTLQNIANEAANSGTETGVRISRILNEVSRSDDTRRNALIYSLMQIPAYREYFMGK